MPIARFAASFLVLVFVGSALAQDRHGGSAGHAGHVAATQSPYAGLEQRAVKALSPLQMADLQAGRGMSLALAAELNGYPGPLHTLELADRLGLSEDQRKRTAQELAGMKNETIAIGQRIIAAETDLDLLFAGRSATPTAVDALVSRIAAAQGDLRAAHLRYHLVMMNILSSDQVAAYTALRGYAPAGQKAGPER